jgi:uncharacterized protein YjbJ (UPF0337 family)
MGPKTDQLKGHAKEVVGDVTGDEALKSEGTADRVAGEVKEKLADVTDKVEGLIDKVKETLHRK